MSARGPPLPAGDACIAGTAIPMVRYRRNDSTSAVAYRVDAQTRSLARKVNPPRSKTPQPADLMKR
ncbi:hypothetical protein OAN307_c38120 [Octadecabacter antarcticus 307]|uniref:Uncharacterized protein n=1 Tax=Octadecabacter antarcticus 307 TaxID=391626 RepID=M9RAN3_9RHOB|nr:hypothetical protein OAN307_c38120 [Octadecabacter antarcticus 307]